MTAELFKVLPGTEYYGGRLLDGICNGGPNNFAVIEAYNLPLWHRCRVEFAQNFKTHTFLFYAGSGIEAERVIKFIEVIENKLNLTDRTVFSPTTIESVVHVVIPPFWKDDCRLSLFTIFLRAGRIFDGDIGSNDSKHVIACYDCNQARSKISVAFEMIYRCERDDWDDCHKKPKIPSKIIRKLFMLVDVLKIRKKIEKRLKGDYKQMCLMEIDKIIENSELSIEYII